MQLQTDEAFSLGYRQMVKNGQVVSVAPPEETLDTILKDNLSEELLGQFEEYYDNDPVFQLAVEQYSIEYAKHKNVNSMFTQKQAQILDNQFASFVKQYVEDTETINSNLEDADGNGIADGVDAVLEDQRGKDAHWKTAQKAMAEGGTLKEMGMSFDQAMAFQTQHLLNSLRMSTLIHQKNRTTEIMDGKSGDEYNGMVKGKIETWKIGESAGFGNSAANRNSRTSWWQRSF